MIRNLKFIALILFLYAQLSFALEGEFDVEYSAQEGKFLVPFGKTYDYANILVRRVVDGDTVQLENGQRLRLIGIDTPEMHESDKLIGDSRRTKQDIHTIKRLGRKAYEFTKNLVESKRVSLEFDVEKYDRYKRLLAYVYLKDGTFVNAKIVEEGYASLMTIPPNVKYADLFLRLYQQARADKKGLWKE